jgi:Flp pilus assembly protein TadB
MDTTTILYVGLLLVLGGSAVYLIVRDLNEADLQRRKNDDAETPKLSTLPFAGDQTPPDGMTDRMDFRFRGLVHQTGLDVAPEAAFLLMVFTGLVFGGGLLVWRDDLLLAVLGFSIGFAAPWTYYVYRRNQRLAEIREQLPSSMDLMSRAKPSTRRSTAPAATRPNRWESNGAGRRGSSSWACRFRPRCGR